MKPADLVIRNGKVAVGSSLRNFAIASSGGRISWVGSNSNAPAADRIIDASGLVVLPGVIDAHVHLREPGATYKEDFRTGTAAAAAGGVTTVLDMPNNDPPIRDLAAFADKVAAAGERAMVDYGLYGLLAEGNSSQVVPMVEAGAIGFKWYMAETTGKIPPPSDEEVSEELALVSRSKRRVSVHAEDDRTVKEGIARLRALGRTDPRAHLDSRPEAAEARAVREAISLARKARCDLNVAHLSSEAGAAAVRRAKRTPRGWSLTAETCPQYLLLDENDYKDKGSIMKVNPSVKRKKDKVALWLAIEDGTVDIVATDHAPHTLEEKTSGESIFERPSGFPGLETSVALMLTCVSKKLLTLARYVELSSSVPAKAWGLYPRKGQVAVGADADLTLVDTRKEWKIDSAKFESKAKFSPFDGFKARGCAIYTIVRGAVVMDHGHLDRGHRGEMQRPR